MDQRDNPNKYEAYLSIQYFFTFNQDHLECDVDKYWPIARKRDSNTYQYSHNTGLAHRVYQDIRDEFDAIETAHFNAIIAGTIDINHVNPLTRHIASFEVLPNGKHFFSFTYFGS